MTGGIDFTSMISNERSRIGDELLRICQSNARYRRSQVMKTRHFLPIKVQGVIGEDGLIRGT